ncbi:hypothetical protein DBV15_06397 [Temnothorax longispinosus]|uniref:Uncharacterized protein n=1 Tax=Temnothorax longispinosus TaxID=300112 RepID=A0A4V3SA28_9HYME|nr:hypothetical protein DBV15_06397 [Temnothorax longispinosus]
MPYICTRTNVRRGKAAAIEGRYTMHFANDHGTCPRTDSPRPTCEQPTSEPDQPTFEVNGIALTRITGAKRSNDPVDTQSEIEAGTSDEPADDSAIREDKLRVSTFHRRRYTGALKKRRGDAMPGCINRNDSVWSTVRAMTHPLNRIKSTSYSRDITRDDRVNRSLSAAVQTSRFMPPSVREFRSRERTPCEDCGLRFLSERLLLTIVLSTNPESRFLEHGESHRVAIEQTKYFVRYVHHRLRKPPCSLAQIPRCTLILNGVHRAFTPKSQHKRREVRRHACSFPVSLSGVPQRLDTPLRRRAVRHARTTTDLSKWILSRPHSTSRAYNPPRPRGTRRFLAATSKRCLARARLDCQQCQLEKVGPPLAAVRAKCAGRIVERYYVPEMLVAIRIKKKIARFYFSLLLAPVARRRTCSSPEETFRSRVRTCPVDPPRPRPNDPSRRYQPRSRDSCSRLHVESDLNTRRVRAATAAAASSTAGGRDSDQEACESGGRRDVEMQIGEEEGRREREMNERTRRERSRSESTEKEREGEEREEEEEERIDAKSSGTGERGVP